MKYRFAENGTVAVGNSLILTRSPLMQLHEVRSRICHAVGLRRTSCAGDSRLHDARYYPPVICFCRRTVMNSGCTVCGCNRALRHLEHDEMMVWHHSRLIFQRLGLPRRSAVSCLVNGQVPRETVSCVLHPNRGGRIRH